MGVAPEVPAMLQTSIQQDVFFWGLNASMCLLNGCIKQVATLVEVHRADVENRCRILQVNTYACGAGGAVEEVPAPVLPQGALVDLRWLVFALLYPQNEPLGGGLDNMLEG